jgi:hypothetical protein
MGKAGRNDATGKRKTKGLKLRDLVKVGNKLGRNGKKRKKQKVNFKELVAAWPACANNRMGDWWKSMCDGFHEKLMKVIWEELDWFSCARRNYAYTPWKGVKYPNDHPRVELEHYEELSSDEKERKDTEERWKAEEREWKMQNRTVDICGRLGHAFGEIPQFPSYEERGRWGDCYGLVAPIACAFVHRTDWRTDLQEFRQNSVTFVDSIYNDIERHCDSEMVELLIRNWANKTEEWRHIESDEFWRGYEKTNLEEHIQQFLATLEICTKKFCTLIMELEETFKNEFAESIEEDLNRRFWEVLVVDWIREEEEEAYLFLYATPGEFFYYKDYVKSGEK